MDMVDKDSVPVKIGDTIIVLGDDYLRGKVGKIVSIEEKNGKIVAGVHLIVESLTGYPSTLIDRWLELESDGFMLEREDESEKSMGAKL